MRKFEFQKAYEEVEVAGEVYRIDLSDDKIKGYQQEFGRLQADIQQLEKADTDKMTDDERLEHFDKMKEIIKRGVEYIVGEGAFDKLYEASGRSLANLMDFVYYLTEIVGERAENMREDKRKQYVKKK